MIGLGNQAIDYTKFTLILDPLKSIQLVKQKVYIDMEGTQLTSVNESQNILEAHHCNNPGNQVVDALIYTIVKIKTYSTTISHSGT